jgi:signal transduction histidine kinase
MTAAVYGLGALIVLLGLGGVTRLAFQLERREYEAAAQRRFGETIQLALWRMESTLLPIINSEVGTPYFYYRSFYPAEGAYTRMWEEVPPDAVLVESPLLTNPGPYALLHFEIGPDGTFSSPQVPTGNMRDQAEAGDPAMSARIIASENRLRSLRSFLAPASKDKGERYAFSDLDAYIEDVERVDQLSADDPDDSGRVGESPAAASQQLLAQDSPRQKEDFEARKELLRLAQQSNIAQRDASGELEAEFAKTREKAAPPPSAPLDLSEALASDTRKRAAGFVESDETGEIGLLVREADAANGPMIGMFRLVWRTGPDNTGGQLVMLRSVDVRGQRTVQGVWLDWEGIESLLLKATSQLLPQASLRPVYSDALPEAAGQRLASVPAVLEPGPMEAIQIPMLTPTRAAVGVSWAAVLAAVGAIGLVLRKSTDLAERRGQFVTAVTHELRTPMTTFCLYTQMLADGMVREEGDRQHYLVTLKRESRRLAGIVENVLDYARLGQRRVQATGEAVSMDAVFNRVEPALMERAEAAGMALSIERIEPDVCVRADATTIERILVNLVDNACKYASEGERIEIVGRRTGASEAVEVCVRDFGPGVGAGEAGRIFQPFHRAKAHAESPNPGLGLGLALARGLAREMGGDLVLGRAGPGKGAVFCLKLAVDEETPSQA